jgi:hypothetical protein
VANQEEQTMIDPERKTEVDLIVEAAERMARRVNGTFVIDPAKVHDFPSDTGDASGYKQVRDDSEADSGQGLNAI